MAIDLPELARRMLADYDARTPGRQTGVSPELTTLTSVDAYALQAEVARLREARGEKVIGYKVGCTSKPIQVQLGVSEPIFGRLFDTECHPSGTRLSAARYANLAVEGELAVRLSRDLPSGPASAEACREAIAEVFPVIELHHYVLPAAWPPGQWLVASNGLHAGFVLAEPESSGAVRMGVDVARVAESLSVRVNEVVVGAVEATASLVSPIESLRWLSGRLAQFGLQLRKDQVILTGSPLRMFPVAPDSRIIVDAPPWGASRIEICPSL